MRILYDDQIFSMQRYGGISRYFCELINCCRDVKGYDYDITTRFPVNAYVGEYKLVNRTFRQGLEAFALSRLGSCKKYEQYASATKTALNHRHKASLLAGRYDIFHPTYYDPYFLPLIGDKPLVLTVYDMIHELFPHMYAQDDPTREWKKMLVSRADKIIAISQSTKNDLMAHLDVPEDKIAVVHLASSIRPDESPGMCEVPVPDNYLFFVGERIRYKNFSFFIKSVTPLLKADRTLKVVCAGGGPLTAEERVFFQESGIDGKVLQYTVNDGTLAHLYRKAAAFIFPSLYEGFGMPVLEAFTCGCPAIVSNTSSFPEVALDAALYMDPADESSLCCAVEKVLGDKDLRHSLVNAGFKRAQMLTWRKTAAETLKLYKATERY